MTLHVSVLIDGDNIGAKHASNILTLAAQLGDVSLKRVYANALCSSDWDSAAGYRMFHAGAGKNAADLLLALDAMELLLSKDKTCFVIVSSDGDFTHLALRLREHGATVVGIGEQKAPKTFRASCSDFIEIGAKPAVHLVPKQPNPATGLDQMIRAMILVHSEKGAGMPVVQLGQKMFSKHGIRISTHPERRWRDYLAARPALFELGPPGPNAMVRFHPAGFAKAA